MNILFEDNHIIVVEKPSGLPTQKHAGWDDSLEERVKKYIQIKHEKKGNVFLHAIFRLDTNASGIVLFAKSQKALTRLQEALRSHLFCKEYKALVQKAPPLGLHTNYLIHGERKAFEASREDPLAKEAQLIIDSICPVKQFFELSITLLTGRYHQIRAQLSSLGCPIIGDLKYGSKISMPEGAIALHHYKISFPHPTTKQTLTFVASKPNIF